MSCSAETVNEKMDADKMPPPQVVKIPEKIANNSFNSSIGKLRRRQRQKGKSKHNKTFVSQQLCALERKNKGIIKVLAEVRQSNTQLELNNYRFKQKQIDILVKNASTNKKLKTSQVENTILKAKLAAKEKILNDALSMHGQFESIINAMNSNQSNDQSDLPYFQLQYNLGSKDSRLAESSQNFITTSFDQNITGVTHRPRRTLKNENQNLGSQLENSDKESLLSNCVNPLTGLPDKMPALFEEQSHSEDENALEADTLNDNISDLNISEESESLNNTSVATSENNNFRFKMDDSSQSYEDDSLKEIVCDGPNLDSDVIVDENVAEGGDSLLIKKSTDAASNEYSDEILAEKLSKCNHENEESPTEGDVLLIEKSDAAPNKRFDDVTPEKLLKSHQENEESPVIIEKVNFGNINETKTNSNAKHPSRKTQSKVSKPKKKLSKKSKTITETLNKSTYDFLSCSSDSFLIDEEKRIKLHNSIIYNDENPSPPKRTSRARGTVSYAEPSLRAKVRRGDKMADATLYNPIKHKLKTLKKVSK